MKFAVFFAITDWVASRLYRARFKMWSVMHFLSPSSDWSHACPPEIIRGSDILFFLSAIKQLPAGWRYLCCHCLDAITILAIGVSKEHETEIFEITIGINLTLNKLQYSYITANEVPSANFCSPTNYSLLFFWPNITMSTSLAKYDNLHLLLIVTF